MTLPSHPSSHGVFGLLAIRPARRSGWFVAGAVIALLGSAAWVGGATPRLTPEDVHIEVPADSLFGSLPINRGLIVSVYIPAQPAGPSGPFMAIFESPVSAAYRVPLEIDHDRHRYSATVDLGRLSTTMGDPPKAVPIQILIARQRGLQLEELVRRTVVVTIAIPGYADRNSAGLVDLSTHLTGLSRQLQSRPAEPTLLDGMVEEEDLPGDRGPARQEGYWKMVQRLIRRQMQDAAPSERDTAVRRIPGIGFRLYANGDAQLIEIERSSGDLELDQAALLAVVNAHPFPPFPAGTRDSHIDVHVDLPAFAR